MRSRFSGCFAILASLIVTLVAYQLDADIALPKLFADHMVLQQNQSMRINGTADADQKLNVTFNQQVVEAVADKNGRWSAIISTGPAGGPFQLEVASQTTETKVVFNDVLVGEVWICSGQSNMRFPVSQSANAEQVIEAAKNFPTIRAFNVAQNASVQPLKDFSDVDSWYCCSPDSIKEFSAIAYLFGRELSKKLKVPVGLIHVASDGTTLEAWTPYDTLKNDGSFDQLLNHWDERNEPTNPNRASNSFNAMIAPLAGFAFRGVIWYQGEANVGRGAQYRRMFPLMIQSWRKKLGQPQCPFLFVQPTPSRYPERPVEALPELWDAQLKTLDSVEGTGMVVTTDLGNPETNQPANKQPVAERLSDWAFAGCYSKLLSNVNNSNGEQEASQHNSASNSEKNADVSDGNIGHKELQETLLSLKSKEEIIASGPIFSSAEKVGNQIVIRFKMAANGLVLKAQTDHEFTICGEDRKFVMARVRVDGNKLFVSHQEIQSPVAVRYGWTDTCKPTLRNSAGLPASPFRTDEFPLISDGVEF